MLSNNQTKLITSLKHKKYRDKHGLFVAEGPKLIDEFISEGKTPVWFFSAEETPGSIQISERELKKISFLRTPNTSLAVFEKFSDSAYRDSGLVVVLDSVRDPGNLGTIIRLCDWFGIEQLVCSEDSVDCYNPKVVQSTMGSLARVRIFYEPLPEFLKKTELPVFGSFMDGKNIYTQDLPEKAVLVMGNESEGISGQVSNLISHRISIPQFGKIRRTESLNVATATAVFLSEFKRFTEM